mgnify:FL=1
MDFNNTDSVHEVFLALKNIADRLAYPEKYVDTKGWHGGDGPFELYAFDLGEEAKAILDKISNDAR